MSSLKIHCQFIVSSFAKYREHNQFCLRALTTSRPLLLHAIAKQTTHAGQTLIKVTSTHGKIGKVKLFLGRITTFFNSLKHDAEQLTGEQRWYRILSKAVEQYLQGRKLQPPIYMPLAT